MKKKHLLAYVLFGFIMLQYQNCAPTSQNFDEPSGITDDVGVVNQVVVGGVFFPQEKVTASSDEAVVVIGTCDQSGAFISWTLKSEDGSIIERGLSECDQGAFEVELSDQWQNHCLENLSLKAALGAKASSETTVNAQCIL